MDNAQGTRRRQVLGIGVAVIGNAIVKRARAQTKVSQAQAQYQDKPKNGQQCDGCAQFEAPSSCKLVDGKIAPQGWCMFFVKKPG
ncbi:MAG TPA: high-potential iron-sulfur protein [Burkholderiaceae bacterium]|nr:high-potential iron-sulfur protein [Burkholderiaceae bacterium]